MMKNTFILVSSIIAGVIFTGCKKHEKMPPMTTDGDIAKYGERCNVFGLNCANGFTCDTTGKQDGVCRISPGQKCHADASKNKECTKNSVCSSEGRCECRALSPLDPNNADADCFLGCCTQTNVKNAKCSGGGWKKKYNENSQFASKFMIFINNSIKFH